MEWWLVLIIAITLLMAFFLSGLPVAFAFLLFNIIGAIVWMGGVDSLYLVAKCIYPAVGQFGLVALPMFIFMGEILFRTGLVHVMIDGIAKWIGGIRGSLSLVAVAAGTMFSVMSGASMSSCAVLGETLYPEMREKGYSKSMSLGPILGSSGLAMIIPPSILAVVLASLARISVGKLLLAGVIPGLLVAGLYTTYILMRVRLQPHLAPPYAPPHVTWGDRFKSLGLTLPLLIIVFLVLGVLFLGVATPSEAAALGATGAFILAIAYRKLTWETIKRSVLETVKVSAMMLMIITGSLVFSQLLAFTGASAGLVTMATDLPVPPIVVVIFMQLVLLFLGMFVDGISMMMITIPIYFPVIYALGFDPFWFGILMLLNVEIGTTSPPFGVNNFVMKGVVPDVSMTDIYLAGIPFILCDLVAMVIMMICPSIVTWLPGLMY